MTFREILFLVNPQAGGGRARRVNWQKVCAFLDARCRVVMSQSPEEAVLYASQFCQTGARCWWSLGETAVSMRCYLLW